MTYNMSALETAELAQLGCRVARAGEAITTGENLFTVVGGNCYVRLFMGEVTADVGNESVDLTIVATPTVGTATDIGALVAVDDDETGSLYTVEGLAADAIQVGSSGSVPGGEQGFVVAPGTIDATFDDSTGVGAIAFTLWYVPLETGAYIIPDTTGSPKHQMDTREAAAVMGLGTRVDRATANMTNGLCLFNVEGGNCLLTLVLGEVTTLIQTTTVENKLVLDVDTGTDTDMCAVLDWSALEAGTLLTLEGQPDSAMQAGSSGSVPGATYPIVVAPGGIDITVGATHTGSVQWSLWYIPLEPGAYIEST